MNRSNRVRSLAGPSPLSLVPDRPRLLRPLPPPQCGYCTHPRDPKGVECPMCGTAYFTPLILRRGVKAGWQ